MFNTKKICLIVSSMVCFVICFCLSSNAYAQDDVSEKNTVDVKNKFEEFVFDNSCLSTRGYSNEYKIDEIESMKFRSVDVDEEGYISYAIEDFDNDNDIELLVIEAHDNKTCLNVYEYDKEESKIVLMDSYDIMNDCKYKEKDDEEGFFSLTYTIDLFYRKEANGIKIYLESWFDNTPVSDGYAWLFKEFEYKKNAENKMSLVNNNTLQIGGSDLGGEINAKDTSGESEDNIIKALKEYKFDILYFYWSNMIMTQDKSLIPIVRFNCNVNKFSEKEFMDNYYTLDENKKKNASLSVDLSFDYYKKKVIDINKLDFLYDKKFNYTGKAIVPDIFLHEVRAYQLRKDRDYVVTCSNNIYPGKATCKIVGVGNYSGTIICNFNIVVSSIVGLKETVGSNTIKLTWTNNKLYGGVNVERYDASKKKYVSYKNITSNVFLDTKLASIKTYAYRLRPYVNVKGKKVYGAYSKVMKLVTKPTVPTVTCKNKNKKAVLSWKKVAGVTGYIVYRKQNNGKFVKIKTVNYKTLSITDSVSKGKKYSYKMVAYKKIGSTVLTSAYSKVLNISI